MENKKYYYLFNETADNIDTQAFESEKEAINHATYLFNRLSSYDKKRLINFFVCVSEENYFECDNFDCEIIRDFLQEEKNEKKAIAHICDKFDIEDISYNERDISIHECRSGRIAAWYLDNEKELAVYIDDLHELTQEEIEKEMC